MTDSSVQAPDDQNPPEKDDRSPAEEGELARVTATPLWRVRMRMLARSTKQSWGLFTENKIGIVGLVIIGVFAVMALAHPILMSTVWDDDIYDPVAGYHAPKKDYEIVNLVEDRETQMQVAQAEVRGYEDVEVGDVISVRQQPAPPSGMHWLGTDPVGRDVFSQLLFGTRAAFLLGLVASLVTVFLATTVGAVAAYFGGVVDVILMRLADLFLLMPLIPVLAFFSGLFEPSMLVLGVLVGLVSGFGGTAILLKSQALSVKVKPFIDAARVAGGSHAHIIFRHIVPNVMPLAFFSMMVSVTLAIGTEATLSWLGLLNFDMSWGIMIQVAQQSGYLMSGPQYWWLLVPAGAAVTLLAAAFYLVGRAMDEVVNPRLRRR